MRKITVFISLCFLISASIGQDFELKKDFIQRTFSVFEEIVKGKVDVNTLDPKQIALWATLEVYSGVEGGSLDYAGITAFNKTHLRQWKRWYRCNCDQISWKEFERIYGLYVKSFRGTITKEEGEFLLNFAVPN